ncbi:MAG: flagellar basal body-associated FliL family protein [Rhizobiales bacterium]|nr:flagellar basal body-associated FliL family protein [Hyphomicrobiales bacterium]
MADEQTTEEKAASSEPSIVVWLAILGVLTLIAGGTGAGLGLLITPEPAAVAEQEEDKAETEEEEKPEYSAGEQVTMLPPIITNLVSPRGTYIRLEGAVVFSSVPEGGTELLVSKITDDILSVLHTMTLAQIEGASGLQHLREDLSARAAIRSDGLAKEIVLHSLVVE